MTMTTKKSFSHTTDAANIINKKAKLHQKTNARTWCMRNNNLAT